ncbi:PO113 protein, partial [Dicaeum eximium]|nr:PO113 protein [Dicaeum eximium]
EWSWIPRPLRERQPIKDAVTVFTDAGKKSRKAAITWKEGKQWREKMLEAIPSDSLQTLELWAVVWALTMFTGPVNVITDSLYIAGVAQRIEDASVKEVQNRRLYDLF